MTKEFKTASFEKQQSTSVCVHVYYKVLAHTVPPIKNLEELRLQQMNLKTHELLLMIGTFIFLSHIE